jgi:hypothetical protein
VVDQAICEHGVDLLLAECPDCEEELLHILEEPREITPEGEASARRAWLRFREKLTIRTTGDGAMNETDDGLKKDRELAEARAEAALLRGILREVRTCLDGGALFLPKDGPEREKGMRLLDRMQEVGLRPHDELSGSPERPDAACDTETPEPSAEDDHGAP